MPKAKSDKSKSVKSSRVRSANYSPVAASVKRLYNKSAPLLICEALLFGVAAILMVIKPVAVLTALTFVVGIALVLFGLYRTIAGFVVSRDAGGGWFDVVFGKEIIQHHTVHLDVAVSVSVAGSCHAWSGGKGEFAFGFTHSQVKALALIVVVSLDIAL